MSSNYTKDNKIKIDIVQKTIDTYEKKLSTTKDDKEKERLLSLIKKEKDNLVKIKLKYAEELL